jgi:hypothetical protein
VTPADLWTVPPGMSPALLATLRAAAAADLSQHSFSDLMAYGMYLLYAVVINLGWGLTVRIAREFFLEPTFRSRVGAALTDLRLRDSVLHLETTLPEQTRKAIVRQFDLLLASPPARIGFGLAPALTRELLPARKEVPTISLGNFGPTPQRPPALAKAMATNRLIDVLTAANVRPTASPELLLVEEVGVLVKQPAVAEYLLEASRTLRWKGLSIICVAQDPANAVPKEIVTALVLNAKWFLAFECGKDEALWLLPHMPSSGTREAEERRLFIAEMAKLPTQHAVFVRKGLPGIRFRVADVADPTRTMSRERLMTIFETKIAAQSMVRTKTADEAIHRFEAGIFTQPSSRAPEPTRASSAAEPKSPGSLDEFFALLTEARKGKDSA